LYIYACKNEYLDTIYSINNYTMVLTEDVKALFRTVRTMLGAPIRIVQLEDEQLCDLLDVAVGDYAEKVQNWVLETQWLNIQNKNTIQFQNANELAYAMTIRTMDWSRDYSYWFSREVGLQQRGPYELKKDFFQVERGKQVYVIPAGREINKVMYVTPSTTKAALYGNLGTLDTGIGGGFGQYGNMGNGMGITGFYVGSAYDTALMAADLKYKNSLLRGDLAYQVTAGPEGTHLVHLLSVPGSPNMVGGIAADDTWGWNRYANCYVWYTYYDVSGSDDAAELCRLENKDDVIITPDEVPFDKMRYELMNNPTQQIIRRLLVAEAKILLGIIRGTYSGTVKIPEAEMQMDYNMLLEQGKSEKETVLNELKERLERMTPWNLMEKQSTMNEQLIKVLKNKPLGLYVR
jgi:hypothetical protein